ncbi:MAG: aquaporin [Nitrospinae bacterium]|nr:aquaporin [Nitrospinota bacterium]
MAQSSLVKRMVAEGIGTFGLMFAGCGTLMVIERFPGSVPGAAVPVVFGAAVGAMIYTVGHISGAHFNPAVTCGFAVVKRFPAREVIPYWAAQVAGAVAAIALLWGILPEGTHYGETIPSVSSFKAVLFETALTFLLMFVIISTATDKRAWGTMAGAAIGATVMFNSYFGGPVTGASMNPARSLAPALFHCDMDGLWIYLIGPVLGASLAAILYESLRGDRET